MCLKIRVKEINGTDNLYDQTFILLRKNNLRQFIRIMQETAAFVFLP